ncbi:hypothetical protein Hanom_Chr15g01375451 [Helianthus anomalus]
MWSRVCSNNIEFQINCSAIFFRLIIYVFLRYIVIFEKSKLPFWSLWFGYFCHFSPKLKPFASGSLWYQFYCHFGPKIKLVHICLIKSCNFVLFLKGK